MLIKKARVAVTPRDWLLKTTLANGAIVYGKNRSGFGGRGIYLYQDEIEPEFKYLEKFLEKNGVFVDVGANTGIYSIKAAKFFENKGVVLAIEPFPDILATMYHSIQANGFTNVRLRNFCAGERTITSKLWMNMGQPNSFSLVKRDVGSSCLSTLTVALDDLFMWEKLDRFDYLKIDAEGAEQQVLDGAKKILEKYRPIVQIEVSIHEPHWNHPNYSIFRALESPNKVYIPNESDKITIPQGLGWKEIG